MYYSLLEKAEWAHSPLTHVPAPVTIFRKEQLDLGFPRGALRHKLLTSRNGKDRWYFLSCNDRNQGKYRHPNTRWWARLLVTAPSRADCHRYTNEIPPPNILTRGFTIHTSPSLPSLCFTVDSSTARVSFPPYPTIPPRLGSPDS